MVGHSTVPSNTTYSDPHLLYHGAHSYDYEAHWLPHSRAGTPVEGFIPQPRFYSQGAILRAGVRANTPPTAHQAGMPFAYGYQAGVTSDPLGGRGLYMEAPYAG